MNDLLEPVEGVDPDALDAAVAEVRAFCGWHIAPSRTDTVTVKGSGSVVILPSLYVTDVASVATAEATVTDLMLWYPNGVIEARYSPYWGWAALGATVTFTHGYDVCPADVRAAVLSLAKGSTPGGTVRVGQISVTSPTEPGLGSMQARLQPYRRPKLA